MACKELADSFPEILFFPSSPRYTESKTSYFAAFENEVSPECIFQPTSTSDVAEAMKVLQAEQYQSSGCNVKIAIRGGGHTSWAGAANIEKGITFDLRRITGVKLDDSKTIASIGAGETWGSVYKALYPTGLAVSGGRVAKVGVGGLITGGGLSYFSGLTGFVCDSVVNFEVVLASGEIVNANADEHSDLFVALKGGANNFGIVTRFDLFTFKQGDMWGGFVFYDAVAVPKLLQGFFDFSTSPATEDNALIVSATWIGAMQTEIGAVHVINVKGQTDPDPVKPFMNIPNQTQNTIRNDTLLAFAEEQSTLSEDGDRQFMFVSGFKPNLELIMEMHQLWQSTMKSITDVEGLAFSWVLQPLTVSILSKANEERARTGKNSLGIDGSDGPLVINSFNMVYLNAADDQKIIDTSLKLIAKMEELAGAEDAAHRYRFLNYGFKGQKVLEGYGWESVAHLKAVSKKYDPNQFFQERVPGGFKLAEVRL